MIKVRKFCPLNVLYYNVAIALSNVHSQSTLLSIMLQNLPSMLLAFPKFFAYYAHFHAS